MSSSIKGIAVALFAVAMCAGCSPSLRGTSGAPPGLTLRHDYNLFEDDSVTLSKGTAYALDCYDPMEGTCDNVAITSGDPKVVGIITSHMERTTDWYGEKRRIPARPGFIVTAVGPGESFVTVTGPGGQTRLRVVVE